MEMQERWKEETKEGEIKGKRGGESTRGTEGTVDSQKASKHRQER